ncbi:uncharacterized protein LOC116203062 [Punica granatum]|uniref:Uncharacterized protein LOC116203062 n=1 Tax=Punica granatum TaxID=22663 RepID=A0A6P8DGS7_PUNGR|nr:uncharacterized protein LOC116203062 [Punica granatum]
MGRRLKICCGVFAVLLLIITVTILVLYFTILKPKQPIMTSQPVMLEHFTGNLQGQINVTLGITVTVYNRNYGSFRYNDSTTHITYRATEVADAPIKKDNIPARARHNISTSVNVFVDKLALVPGFGFDLLSGVVNVTASTTLHGRVKVLKLFKTKATTESTCDVSIFLIQQRAESVCIVKVKF